MQQDLAADVEPASSVIIFCLMRNVYEELRRAAIKTSKLFRVRFELLDY